MEGWVDPVKSYRRWTDARTRRPVDVIGHGHTALVEEAARAFADGSYV